MLIRYFLALPLPPPRTGPDKLEGLVGSCEFLARINSRAGSDAGSGAAVLDDADDAVRLPLPGWNAPGNAADGWDAAWDAGRCALLPHLDVFSTAI